MDFSNTRNYLNEFKNMNTGFDEPDDSDGEEQDQKKKKTLQDNVRDPSFTPPEVPLVLAPHDESEAPPTPDDKPKSLTDSIRKNAVNSDPVAAGKEIVPKEEKKSALDQWKALAADTKYNRPKDSYDEKSLKEALAQAKQLYKEESTRNEWLEVAQMLARAGVQFAAAGSGAARSGTADLHKLDFGPGIDYSARTDRARKDFQQEADNIEHSDDRRRKDMEDIERQTEQDYKRQEDPIEAQFKSEENEKDRLAREKAERIKAGREKTDLTDYRNRQQALAVLTKQEDDAVNEKKIAAKNDEEVNAALDTIASGASLDPKQQRDLEKKYPWFAGAAQKASAQRNTLPNITQGRADEETKNVAAALAPYRDKASGNLRASLDKLSDIRRKKEGLASGQISPKEVFDQQNTSTPPKSNTNKTMTAAQLQAYATQYKMTEEKARTYLQSQGYTLQ
jgi:hypothetical protein